jgi:hypothetical protein
VRDAKRRQICAASANKSSVGSMSGARDAATEDMSTASRSGTGQTRSAQLAVDIIANTNDNNAFLTLTKP